MIKIIPKSQDSVLGEKHLYTIMFGLQDILEIYKLELEKLKAKKYEDMSGEEIHIEHVYENKIYDTENILKEINIAIENIKD